MHERALGVIDYLVLRAVTYTSKMACLNVVSNYVYHEETHLALQICI